MHYTGVTDGKKEKVKVVKKFKHCDFLLHEILQSSVDVYKIEDSGSLRHWEMCDEKFYRRKRKNDK